MAALGRLRQRKDGPCPPRHTCLVRKTTRPAEPAMATTVAELLAAWPSARSPLARHGMACIGCPMARFETVGEAAAAYGLEPRELLSEIVHAVSTHGATRRPAR